MAGTVGAAGKEGGDRAKGERGVPCAGDADEWDNEEDEEEETVAVGALLAKAADTFELLFSPSP